MIGRFENLTIKSKLVLFTMGICGIAVFAGFCVLLVNDVKLYKDKMRDEYMLVARLTAENCVYSLEFGNRTEARETLAHLVAIQEFEGAALYNRDNNLFVTYPDTADVPKNPATGTSFHNEYASGGYFEVTEPVIFNDEPLGTIYLRVSTQGLAQSITRHLFTMGLIFGGALLVSWVLVLRFQHLISDPIVVLARVTKKITERGDYSIRVGETTGKEMRLLYAGFNAMLAQIQKERSKLARFNESLEGTVRERTSQLEESMRSLETSNLKLEEANRHKTRFLSAMSHELRTPLNAILGFSDLLAGCHFGTLNDKQTRYVYQIENSGKHLLELINDLLDVAKIDAGAMELSLSPFDLTTCIQETLTMLQAQINQKNIGTTIMAQPDLPPLFADKRKIRQILLNLLSNAIKYTPEDEGTIEIHVRKPGNYFRVSVHDNGIGIIKEDQERVFSEFFQADRKRDEVLGGTGIGLALTRRLVELHGGEIGLDSFPGSGSEFWFTLPLKEVPTIRIEEPGVMVEIAEPALSGVRILVAEDNEVNRAMIVDMLGIKDHEVIVATNGQEAILLAEQHRPQLIFMDIRMPIMDGLEATRNLRNNPDFAHTPIIALTASVEPFTKRMCQEAGCTDHLAKPVQSHELFEVIEREVKTNSN